MRERTPDGQPKTGVGVGLTRRTAIASGLLTLLTGLVFAALLWAISGLQQAVDERRYTRTALVEAGQLENLISDLDTGQRGFVITRQESFLQPWEAARRAYSGQAREFARFSYDSGDGRLAQQIIQAGESFIRDYSIPLVEAARRGDPYAWSLEATEEGERRVEALRAQFDRYEKATRSVLGTREDVAKTRAQQVIAGTLIGLAGSILLIVAFAGYLTRAIVQPIRRAAVVAGRLAGGDLTARMPETGVGEIGELEVAFNTMGSALEESRDELRRIVQEQAALRRVATLVACEVSPPEIFNAVATEMGHILKTEYVSVIRYEADGMGNVIGNWAAHGGLECGPPVGSRWPLDEESVAGLVLKTGKPGRITYDTNGKIATWMRERGVSSAVGCPIVVEGRMWGALVAFSTGPGPQPEGREERMAEFTELVATAIANAESRAQLTASRARVVEAADETRRRIERDLHDGTQQRLVTLGLELRAAEATAPPELEKLRQQLSHTAQGLAGAVEDLQEISRGIHPAVLSRGGLGPALKTLARRSAVPVELTVDTDRRLAERVEVAAYYVVSEALTNAAKHARASVVYVDLAMENGIVRISIRDDGVGGADPGHGSGLIGLRDRVDALGGCIEIVSPAEGGTSLSVQIPAEND
ncbi:GAF domain-containing protein [Streptosporangium subroseum]|uniref:histidine kinase n=1 Tax=Streptosporangium subroseum TaxID=106412 RepID=A0A239KI71_9ACTN|nr:CHASE3 domain-containing protein [Streptosporangium subroseum]SNT17392.1 GAF domain-containing protein [Streptosporangium subroseum]